MLSTAVSLMESGQHKSTRRKVYVINAEKETHKQDEIYWHLKFQGVASGDVQDPNPKICCSG